MEQSNLLVQARIVCKRCVLLKLISLQLLLQQISVPCDISDVLLDVSVGFTDLLHLQTTKHAG